MEQLRAERAARGLDRLEPRYNVAPSQDAPVLRLSPEDGVRELLPMRRGLVPHWADSPKTRYSMINARAETVDRSGAYRTPLRRRRCLVPADGFYEWQPTGGPRQPWYITPRGDEVLTFAGLWEHWQDGDTGEEILSFTIIVCDANETLRPLHERMPVILDEDAAAAWLDPGQHDADVLKELLRPYPDDLLQAWPVSRRVNRPDNDDPSLIEPTEQAPSG